MVDAGLDVQKFLVIKAQHLELFFDLFFVCFGGGGGVEYLI